MKDSTRWAKKFDTVAHLYKPEGSGTACGSVSHCLGNNYATKEMKTCTECEDYVEGYMDSLNDPEKKHWDNLATHNERFSYDDRD